METEIKKRKHRKGGTDYAKEKLAKAEAKVMTLESQLANAKEEARRTKHELEKNLNEKEDTIRKQGSKISELSGDLANAQSEAREYRSKFEKAVHRMGWLRRFIYGYNVPKFTDEDHWNE